MDRVRRIDSMTLWGIFFALCAVNCIGCGDAAGPSDRRAAIDVAEVVHEERLILDESRSTRANGTAPGLPRRELATRIWYAPQALATPACRARRCAVVLLAHGLGGHTGRFDAVARRLAAVGYIVAAPTFPLTHEFAAGGSINGVSDVASQPGDLAIVLDHLLEADTRPGDPLRGRIDGERVGALGHSLGGATVLGSTRSTCCTDTRIGAAVLVAPATFVVGVFLGGEVPDTELPTLVVNGRDDLLIRAFASREFARALPLPWYFLEVLDVGHVFLIENIGPPTSHLDVTARAVVAFFDEHLAGDAHATRRALAALVAEGQEAEWGE